MVNFQMLLNSRKKTCSLTVPGEKKETEVTPIEEMLCLSIVRIYWSVLFSPTRTLSNGILLTRGGCSCDQHPPPTTPESWVRVTKRATTSIKGDQRESKGRGMIIIRKMAFIKKSCCSKKIWQPLVSCSKRSEFVWGINVTGKSSN